MLRAGKPVAVPVTRIASSNRYIGHAKVKVPAFPFFGTAALIALALLTPKYGPRQAHQVSLRENLEITICDFKVATL